MMSRVFASIMRHGTSYWPTVLEIMRKSLEICQGLLIPIVEGGSVSAISSATKISEVDIALPKKNECIIRDNNMGKHKSYKNFKSLITATYWDVLVSCAV